jgi:hypothetical protein
LNSSSYITISGAGIRDPPLAALQHPALAQTLPVFRVP